MDELNNSNNQSSIPIYALEGSAFTGKTTLLNHMRENYHDEVITIPEVGEYIGGDKHFPNVPFENLEAARKSTHFFIEIEKRRYENIFQLYEKYKLPILVDRFTFISSLFFYQLLKRSNLQSSSLADGFISHARNAFSWQISKGNIIPPQGIFLLKLRNQETFNKRLIRGTKNSVFTNWNNYQFMTNLYLNFINQYYTKSHLILDSINTEQNTKYLALKTINFIRKNSISSIPQNLFLKQNEQFKYSQSEIGTEVGKYKDIKNKVSKLISQAKTN